MKSKFLLKCAGVLILNFLFLFLTQKTVWAGCTWEGNYQWAQRCSDDSECQEDCMEDGWIPGPGGECLTKYYTAVGREWCDYWCTYEEWVCTPCTPPPPGCGGGCFVEGTEINTEQESKRAGEQEGSEAIENLEPGDIVSSFNPETGEISESQVAEVHKITREGYYELETESGKKVKVTGEHPFLAIKGEKLIDKLKNVLSNTLTFRLITGLKTKLGEVLD